MAVDWDDERDDNFTTVVTGRVDTGLGPMQVHIVHGWGTIRLDPCTAIQAAIADSLTLGPTLGQSVLSGAPAYIYRTREIQLLLTKSELFRLIRHDLLPAEYFKLRQRYGEFFEIEDSFYDETTYLALQPT